MKPETNCVVAAIAWLLGKRPSQVVDWLDEHHGDRTWFEADGGVPFEAFASPLALLGWHVVLPEDGDAFPLPSRCLVVTVGHTFAIEHGRIFDTALGTIARPGDPFIILTSRERNSDE